MSRVYTRLPIEQRFWAKVERQGSDAARKRRLIFQRHPERCPRGERASGAKLTAADFAEVRRLRVAGASQTSLARRFGVSQQAISLLLKGKTWKELFS